MVLYVCVCVYVIEIPSPLPPPLYILLLFLLIFSPLPLLLRSIGRLVGREINTFARFFKGFDWENVRSKEAAIVPEVKSDVDISNFDKFEEAPEEDDVPAVLNKGSEVNQPFLGAQVYLASVFRFLCGLVVLWLVVYFGGYVCM